MADSPDRNLVERGIHLLVEMSPQQILQVTFANTLRISHKALTTSGKDVIWRNFLSP